MYNNSKQAEVNLRYFDLLFYSILINQFITYDSSYF